MSEIKAFINGKIYLTYLPVRKVEAFIIFNDRVLDVGDNEHIIKLARILNAKIIDLNGKVVLPGFIDSHVHLDSLGLYLNMLDLRGVKSINELKERLKTYVEQNRDLPWILGHGWDQELFIEGRWPNRWDLDEVIDDKPVMLTRICLHAAVLNTKAIETLGISDINSPNILRNERGEPTGIITEDIVRLARFSIKKSLSDKDYLKLLKDALRHVVSNGVTMIGYVGCEEKVLKALQILRENKEIPIRIRVYLSAEANMETINTLIKLGIRRGFGDEYLKIMGIKILADGSLGARTAWLSSPYNDMPETSGSPNITFEDLLKIAEIASKSELQLAIHGIGDKTIDMILSVYEKIGRDRHRIEHASVIRDDQIKKLVNLGIVACVQPHFIISDWWVVKRLGVERCKWVYPFKKMIDGGVNMSVGTDCPVEILNPWETVYSAVTRGAYENIELYELSKDQKLGLTEALYYYTYGSAYAMYEEDNYGSLEVGKYADFIVVDKDPFSVEDKELKNIKILETYVGGKKVYNI